MCIRDSPDALRDKGSHPPGERGADNAGREVGGDDEGHDRIRGVQLFRGDDRAEGLEPPAV